MSLRSLKSARSSKNIQIDITPLIDVLFMLIIFFVLTTSFVQGAIDVDLPAGDAVPAAQADPIVVTIDRDSRLYWAGEIVTEDDIPRLAEKAAASGEEILIAGDREARYGDVVHILETLRGLGIEKVGLALEGEK